MLKKSKRRKALKEFEMLQKSDPEAALAKLEELDQLRMEVLLACFSFVLWTSLILGVFLSDASFCLCPRSG